MTIWLIGAGAILALLYLPVTRAAPVMWRTVVKTGATAALALAALTGGAPGWAVLALALGVLGDAFLSRDPARWFLPGLVAFALGHITYGAGLWQIADTPVPVLPAAVLTALAAGLLAWLWRRLGQMRLPVLGYAAISVVLGALAFAQGSGWLLGGVLAFILSDMILAVSLFGLRGDAPVQRVLGPVLWAFYWCGQAAILWGVLAPV